MITVKIERDGARRFSNYSKLVFTVLFITAALLLIGWQETRHNSVAHCSRFATGTSFAGYNCGSDTIYIPKQ